MRRVWGVGEGFVVIVIMACIMVRVMMVSGFVVWIDVVARGLCCCFVASCLS